MMQKSEAFRASGAKITHRGLGNYMACVTTIVEFAEKNLGQISSGLAVRYHGSHSVAPPNSISYKTRKFGFGGATGWLP